MNLAAGIDFSRYRLTRFRVVVICAILIATSVGVSIQQFSNARDYILSGGATVGGDYVAFYTAAHEAADGRAAETYDAEVFEQRLKDVGPPKDSYGLTWQYPPTYFFAVLPLAALAFIPGYILWTGASAAAFFAMLRSAGLSGLFLFVILAAPSTFHAIITGQNGFLTAALLIVATLYADKRPVAAGLAAALLTMKPQIGLLLPIAYIAGGCWRAFFTAALGALALACASVIVFGVGTWGAFLDGFRGASDNLTSGRFPLLRMATPFAAARLAGLPTEAAGIFHALCAAAAATAVGLVWRRIKDTDLRAAIVCAGVFMTAPYGYYYEMVILVFPAAALARRALEEGWLKYEEIILAGIFITPLFVPGEHYGVSLGFIVAAAVFASVLRRIRRDRPDAFTPAP